MQKTLRLPVLNAAMASYGTARELALLERLQLPQFPVLIIQYCDNDFAENKFFIDKGALEITREAQYLSIAKRKARAPALLSVKT